MEEKLELLNCIVEGVHFELSTTHTGGTISYDLFATYENDLPVMVFTTDSPQEMRKYIKAFSDGIVVMYGVQQFKDMR